MKIASSAQLSAIQLSGDAPAENSKTRTPAGPRDSAFPVTPMEKAPEFSGVPSDGKAPKRRYSPRRSFEAAVKHMKKAMESHDRSGNMTFVNVEGSIVHQDARDKRGILKRRRRKQHLTIARIDMED